jgi:hypothetical protein
MRQQIVRTSMLKSYCNEKLFITRYGSSVDYHFASDFVARRCQRHHSHRDGWQRRVRLHAFIRDDSPRRYGTVDLELERSQQHFGYSRSPKRALGFWNSWPGRYVLPHLQHRWVVSVLLHPAWGLLQYGRNGQGDECDAYTYAPAAAHSHSPAV